MRGELCGVAVLLATTTTAAAPAYPRALAERPLLLPDGTFEGALTFAMTDQVGETVPRVRLGLVTPRATVGVLGGELEAAATLAVFRTLVDDAQTIDPARLQALRLAARFAVAHELAVGGELGYGDRPDPLGRLDEHYEARATIARRLAGTRNTLDLAAYVGGAVRPAASDELAGDREAALWGIAGATLRIRVQLAPVVAFEGRAALRFVHDTSALTTEQRDRFVQDYGLGMSWSIAPRLDAFGALDILSRDAEETRISVGVQLRSVP